jgi:signal transduction histidine kinase
VLTALRALWTEPAAMNSPPPARRDWVFSAIVLAAVVGEAILRGDLAWRPIAVVMGCVLAGAILLRRTRPLAAVVLAFGVFAVVDVAAFVADSDPVVVYGGAVVLVLAYALLRWGSGRDAVIGLAVMGVTVITSAGTDFTGPADILGGAAVLLLAAVLGLSVRYRATAREQLVEQARLREREQLARELHDTVAHHVSAIAIQAQAGLILARSSSLQGATESLEVIDREAAHTLTEMRTMVGALRDRRVQPALAPRRCLADIQGLAAGGGGGDALRIDVAFRGDLSNLPPALEAALYRVAQESVTNAQRHAHQATRVEVTVTGSPLDVELTAIDDGDRAPTSVSPAGYGLVGMTERVTLLGGTLTAGPAPDRGWSVRAVLPRRRGAT